jgi:hypothetical protein
VTVSSSAKPDLVGAHSFLVGGYLRGQLSNPVACKEPTSIFTFQNHCTNWLSSFIQLMWIHSNDESITKKSEHNTTCATTALPVSVEIGSTLPKNYFSPEKLSIDIWKIGFHYTKLEASGTSPTVNNISDNLPTIT